jgi:hypothetical protein
MQEMLNSRKRGDHAFRDKDFRVAIDCYTQVCIPYADMCELFLSVCTLFVCELKKRLAANFILGQESAYDFIS